MKKYLKVMLILVVALSLLSTFAFANPFANIAAVNVESSTATNVINTTGGAVISVVKTVGYVIAVVMVLTLGIQWLIGTPAKKQELKGKMWNVLIGAILLIAGVTILGFIYNIVDETGNTIDNTIKTNNTAAAGK